MIAADFAQRATADYREWLEGAQLRAAALVEREWSAVVAVAEALEASKSLAPAVVREIVSRVRDRAADERATLRPSALHSTV